ncbi:unnamed protein product [Bathycoccus prasinos]
MGFAKTLNSIIGMLPKQRRTGLFSATRAEELEGIGESRVAESSPGDGERFKRGSGGSSSGWR